MSFARTSDQKDLLFEHTLAPTCQAGLIGKRTRAALQAAKARGVKLGGPRIKKARAKALSIRKARARQLAENTAPIIRQVQASGATTLRAIAAPPKWEGHLSI